jgi:predicted membrane channel-forming protein YqfA (hemolysin III family)
MIIALFFLLVIALAALDIPSLTRQGLYKDIAVYSLFMLTAIYLAMVQFYHWPFINPLVELARQMQSP